MKDKCEVSQDNPLVDAVERVRQQEYVQAQKTIRAINRDLGNAPNKKMPLDVYKEVFEPLFTGKEELTDDNLHLVGRFISYAGTAKSPVDVVDSNNNIVATIPGLISKTPQSVIDAVPLNLTEVKHKHEHASRVGRGTHTQHLVNLTGDALKTAVSEAEFEKRMIDVLETDSIVHEDTEEAYEVYDD